MKFNVGDRVEIREDLVVGEIYDNYKFTKPMSIYKGYVYTIGDISPYEDCYFLENIPEKFAWTDSMLKLSEEDVHADKELLEKALTILGMTKEELIKEGPFKIIAALVKEIGAEYNKLCESCVKVEEDIPTEDVVTPEIDCVIENNKCTFCDSCEVKDFMIKHNLESYSCTMVFTLLYLFKNNKLNI